MYAEGITVNPNPYTGDNLGNTLTRISLEGDGETVLGLHRMSGTTSAQPVDIEIQHSTIKRGKAKYVRSTIAIIRKKMTAPTDNPEGVGAEGYNNTWRLINERPLIASVLTDALCVQDLGRLLAFFGTTLSTGGTPSGPVQKFLNKEA